MDQNIKFNLLAMFLTISFGGLAQANVENAFSSITPPPTFDFDSATFERVELKKKKPKKNVFYGIKTKKMFTKKGFGDNTTLELFNYIKAETETDPYVRDIHWYNFQRKQIVIGQKVNPEFGVVLHGPYKKQRGQQVLEEGIFYKGTKHGRWVKRDVKDVLIDKEKYYRGWPKESLVRYYDVERTKLREVIPIEYGVYEGKYFYFFESGQLAVSGEYRFGGKVKRWTEYHEGRGYKKKEVNYPNSPNDQEGVAYISKEWDANGKVVYDWKLDN